MPSRAIPPETEVRIADASVVLQTPLDLDFWEVDPVWAGKVFRSAAQAVRPARTGKIPSELKIKTGRNACVRLVTVEGDCYQLHV
jgi:hypothetical protein